MNRLRRQKNCSSINLKLSGGKNCKWKGLGRSESETDVVLDGREERVEQRIKDGMRWWVGEGVSVTQFHQVQFPLHLILESTRIVPPNFLNDESLTESTMILGKFFELILF